MKKIRYLISISLAFLLFSRCGLFEPKPTVPEFTIILENDRPYVNSKQLFQVEVQSPDDETFTVSWEADFGYFNSDTLAASGEMVFWTAPEEPEIAVISATVETESGGQATVNQYLLVLKDNPQITSYTLSSSTVLVGNEITLTAIVEDTISSNYNYQFFARDEMFNDIGSFSDIIELDSMITTTWTAPENEEGHYDMIFLIADTLQNITTSDTLDVVVYFDYGSIWVVDSGHKKVKKFSSEGDYILSVDTTFNKPVAVAINIDESFGCWVADYEDNLIYEISENGEILDITASDSLTHIVDLEIHKDSRSIWALSVDGYMTIIDGWNNTIQKVISGFVQPRSFSINQNTGEVWVADTGNNRIVKFFADFPPDSADAIDVVIFKENPDSVNYFDDPYRISVQDEFGATVYIADKNHNQVEMLVWNADSSRYDRYYYPLTGIPEPTQIQVTTQQLIWVANEEGQVAFLPENEPSMFTPITSYMFDNPSAIGADKVTGKCWIGDNGTKQIVLVNQNQVLHIINGFSFIEDIVVNK